jgi:hypothetical protein
MKDIILRNAIVIVTIMPDTEDQIAVAWPGEPFDSQKPDEPPHFFIRVPHNTGVRWCQRNFGIDPKQIRAGGV